MKLIIVLNCIVAVLLFSSSFIWADSMKDLLFIAKSNAYLVSYWVIFMFAIELPILYLKIRKSKRNSEDENKNFWKYLYSAERWAVISTVVLCALGLANPIITNLYCKSQCSQGKHDFSSVLALSLPGGGTCRIVCSNCDLFANNDSHRSCVCGIVEADLFIKNHSCFTRGIGKLLYLRGLGCLQNPLREYKEPLKHPDLDKDGALIDQKTKNLLYLSLNYKGHYTIPDGVTSIGNGAFSGCSRLTGITIPDSVKSIGARAFMHCTSLTDIIIPNGVVSISDEAFYGCSSLNRVIIPASVTSLGERMFKHCAEPISLTVPQRFANFPRTIFEGVRLKNVTTLPETDSTVFPSAKTCVQSVKKTDIKKQSPIYYELTEDDNMICLDVKKGDRINILFSEIYLWHENSSNVKMLSNFAVDSKAIKRIWHFEAIDDGEVTMNFKSIDSNKSFQVVKRSIHGTDTLFHRAAKKGNWVKMSYLLNSGFPVDGKGDQQTTALALAAIHKNVPLVSFLLTHKADPNKFYGTAPVTVYHSVIQRYVPNDKEGFEVIKYLTENGGNPNIRQGILNVTSFEYALQSRGDISLIKYLVEHGAEITDLAIKSARAEEIRNYLLTARKSPLKSPPKKSIIKMNNLSQIIQLSTAPLDMSIAVKLNNLGMLKFLSEKYPKIFQSVLKSGYLFHLAAASTTPEMLDFLYKQGARYDNKKHKGKTPLEIATKNKNKKNAKWFFDHSKGFENLNKENSLPSTR